MASRRRTTLAAVSSASLNSRGSMGTASSGRSSLASSKQPTSRFSISTSSAGGGARSTVGGGGGGGGRTSMGAARPSMGTSRPSMGRPSMGRPSMSSAGERKSAGVRRTTSFGTGGGGRSDHRPLMDKAHLNASLHKLAAYLTDHGYDQPINSKTLMRPSGRDFNNITGFLFRQLDPNYRLTGRFEDDVVPFLKMVRYPFTISKSSLAAVGAPQTWPKVMGAISWMVDSLLYDEAIAVAEEEQREREREATQEEREQDKEDGVDDQGTDQKNFVDYLEDAYRYFLEGDDESHQAITTEYSEKREMEDAGAEEFLRKLEESNESLAQTNQELLDQGNSLPKLEEGLKLTLSDNDKIASLLEEIKTHTRLLQEKVDKRVEEERRLKEPLPILAEASASLREQISRQEFSAADMEGQLSERQRLRDAVDGAAEAKLKARKEGWSAQVEVATAKEALKENLNRYTGQAEALMLVPPGTRQLENAGDTNYVVEIDEARLDQEDGVLTNDVHGVIRPALKELKIAIVRRTSGLRQDLSNLLVEEDKAEEDITDVLGEVELLYKQAKRKEETYNKSKYALDQQVAGSKGRMEDNERRLESQSGAAESLDRIAAENKAATDVVRMEIEALRERREMDKRESENVLQGMLETVLDYKEREERCLAGLKERYRQHHAAILHGQTAFDAALASEGGVLPGEGGRNVEGGQAGAHRQEDSELLDHAHYRHQQRRQEEEQQQEEEEGSLWSGVGLAVGGGTPTTTSL